MIYQRHIPEQELFIAQLETLMQNGRVATLSAHLVGVIATLLLFWQYLPPSVLLLWAAAFIILLLVRSLQMSNALVTRTFQTSPRRVYWQLIVGALLTGAVWAAIYIYAADHVPVTMQYIFLLVVVMITAFSVGYSVVIREYFIAYVFSALWPIAWWSLVHYWEQSYNLLIGLLLLAFCALLVSVSDRVYLSFRNMISLNWERESIARELGDLTHNLKDRNRQLIDARRQLTDLANIDELTGLGNRRLVNKVLQEEINRARRTGARLSLILLDVDYFKDYNDNYGHPAGDLVLKRLADLMERATSRAGEVVGRYGGEEFILVLPGAGDEAARRTAERLRELVMAEKMPHKHSQVADIITISQGVVTFTPDADESPSELIKRADTALYRAKHQGRNAIVLASDPQPEESRKR
ncbi:MAG: GGDEF domain-containing protein [Pseudomonadales bacterium]|nr:GGDEF domain-containing protein [Pseudomonadales bacterium]